MPTLKRLNAFEAYDVAAEVWLTLSGLAAAGGLPGPDRVWTVMRQIITVVVTDTHPCDSPLPCAPQPRR
ncbi:hypothetical protein [Streptacidiphilus rugosus]|uniref:hypothetical protein n=1 Tax=Streptacidiphilus rugosus TaxID=405783 RepID=UPI000566733A|nr:hypothetical protein [Streptacidiphilus rugosus]